MKVLTVYRDMGGPGRSAVGCLAYRDGRGYFEYDGAYLATGVHLSPFNLEWAPGLQEAKAEPFNGLHGVFSDSLPDGWGLMLMDRAVRAAGGDPRSLTPIDRLAFIGNRGMGALSYEPDEGAGYGSSEYEEIDLAAIGAESTALFEGTLDDVLEHHTVHGTPSGGARPKILIGLPTDGSYVVTGAVDLPAHCTHWIAKFPTGRRPEERAEGAAEYVYYQMAIAAGIRMADCRLHETPGGDAYFLTQRFDRSPSGRRIHMHTLAGMLHANFRVSDFDYGELMKVTAMLTHSYEEKIQLFKRMAFNLLGGNRDDHTKNFAFLQQPDGNWSSAPAYDLTCNSGIAGHHSMAINGKTRSITTDDLYAVAETGSISPRDARFALQEVADSVSRWHELSRVHNIPAGLRREVGDYIEQQLTLMRV